ncbi:MAG: addiction module toxin, Txe/YoeB family [Osedax symbiont Rs1]|nr:MAG: addiction module toxin, Txe/YoeB family [Osedax symbiont Rs1]
MLKKGISRVKGKSLLEVIEINPCKNQPPYEKLVRELDGSYSRRINIQLRLIYQVLESENAIKVLRLWTHYE